MASLYTFKISYRRWPVQAFYNLLDLAVINSVIIYRETLDITISRQDYILQLVEELRLYNEIVDEDSDEAYQIRKCKNNKTKKNMLQVQEVCV